MPGFIYAIPIPLNQLVIGEDIKQDVLREYQLDHLQLETTRQASLGTASIPSLGQCSVIFPAGQDPRVTDALTWSVQEVGYKRMVGVAWQTDAPPTSQDFLKPPNQLIHGYEIHDASDNPWLIPVVRVPKVSRETDQPLKADAATQASPQLPTNITFGYDGYIHRTRKPEAESLWRLSGEIWDYWNGDGDPKPAFVIRCAFYLLQANYRINQVEINVFAAMGQPILDDTIATAITYASINLDLIQQHNQTNDTESKNHQAAS